MEQGVWEGLTDSAGTQQRGAENFTCNCEMHLSCGLRQRRLARTSLNVEFVVTNGSFRGWAYCFVFLQQVGSSSRWPRARSAPATVKLRLFAKRTKRQTYSQQAWGGSFRSTGRRANALANKCTQRSRRLFGAYSLAIIYVKLRSANIKCVNVYALFFRRLLRALCLCSRSCDNSHAQYERERESITSKSRAKAAGFSVVATSAAAAAAAAIATALLMLSSLSLSLACSCACSRAASLCVWVCC